MNNTSIEKIGCFNTILDPYNGITIDSKDLTNDKDEFQINLDYLVEQTQNKRNLIWIYIDIRNTAPLLLKNLKLKVLRKDFSNIYTKGNESIITLLLDVGK